MQTQTRAHKRDSDGEPLLPATQLAPVGRHRAQLPKCAVGLPREGPLGNTHPQLAPRDGLVEGAVALAQLVADDDDEAAHLYLAA